MFWIFLNNQLLNEFYRTKTKFYIKASSVIVYGKEDKDNNLKFWCNIYAYNDSIMFHVGWVLCESLWRPLKSESVKVRACIVCLVDAVVDLPLTLYVGGC